MKERYRIVGTHGRGVFSQVLKVEDLQSEEKTVWAVKVNRNNETMYAQLGLTPL